MLMEKPEQEQRLLELLIKKMADNENKIASNSVYLMTLLLERHPAMKLSLVKEVETFLHRPHISLRAQYYAVIFLNQIILSRNNTDVSRKLLDIYFSLFKRLVSVENSSLTCLLSAASIPSYIFLFRH
jgi:ribosome biogenesis protein MAK21